MAEITSNNVVYFKDCCRELLRQDMQPLAAACIECVQQRLNALQTLKESIAQFPTDDTFLDQLQAVQPQMAAIAGIHVADSCALDALNTWSDTAVIVDNLMYLILDVNVAGLTKECIDDKMVFTMPSIFDITDANTGKIDSYNFGNYTLKISPYGLLQDDDELPIEITNAGSNTFKCPGWDMASDQHFNERMRYRLKRYDFAQIINITYNKFNVYSHEPAPPEWEKYLCTCTIS